jgi:hypothetical protein
MAHVAELDENNKVIRVVVVSNEYEPNVEDFAIGLFGGTWKQTSYNGTIRYNYAGVGYTYDPIDDAFIAPMPCAHDELLLNNLKRWECSNVEHEAKII